LEDLKGGDHVGNFDRNRRIILKWILNEYDVGV
jgi:hypothetical protein